MRIRYIVYDYLHVQRIDVALTDVICMQQVRSDGPFKWVKRCVLTHSLLLLTTYILPTRQTVRWVGEQLTAYSTRHPLCFQGMCCTYKYIVVVTYK